MSPAPNSRRRWRWIRRIRRSPSISTIWQASPEPRRPTTNISATIAPPIELTPTPGRHSFHLKSSEQEILRRVLDAYGIRMVADDSLGTLTVRFDADDIDYAQAASMATLVTNSMIVPLDPVRVLVAKDTKDNRAKYDRLSVETVYLPGLTATEFTDIGNLARNVLGITQTAVKPESGTLTVRAPVGNIEALNKTLVDLLDGKSEVLLDVKIYQVENTRTRLYGIQPPQTTTVFNVSTELNSIISQNSSLVQQIISSGLASAGDYRGHRRDSDRIGRGEQLDPEPALCHLRRRPNLDRPHQQWHHGKPELECGG